jgi:hypothetical protein
MKLITLIITLSCTPLVAFKNIEIHKKEIKTALQKNNPALVKTFNQFCIQYDQSVITFFDRHNNLSLAQHIQRMEKDLIILGKTLNDIQFVSVRALLIDLNNQLQDLVTLLKQYHSSKSSLQLAFKVRKFKKLLPTPINTWSDIALFLSLHHRLRC